MKLNKENIYNQLTQEEIMEKYFPSFVMTGQKYRNPFRADNEAGCYFAWTKNNNFVFFDNAQPAFGGDCIKVCMMQNNVSFMEALSIINDDFNLGLVSNDKFNRGITPLRVDTRKVKQRKKINRKIQYKIKLRKWSKIDKEYWNRFGISLKLLKKYNIRPIQTYSTKKWYYSYFSTVYDFDKDKKDPCYGFFFKKEKGVTVKFYRPLTKISKYKWSGNISKTDIQGYNQLPETGELLIISSSMKDLLTLVALGYNSIAPQGEGMGISKALMQELKARFKQIIVIYDLDAAGEEFAQELAVEHDIEYSELPYIEECLKDFADYREYTTKDEFLEILEFIISDAKKI